MGMKALSIRQPWAGLIVAGIKDIENRSRRTTHRGPLLIHASQRRARRTLAEIASKYGLSLSDELVKLCELTGGIVGEVTIVDCVSASASKWFDGAVSGGKPNWGYILRDARLLPFRRALGRLGVFEGPPDCHPNCHRTALDSSIPSGTAGQRESPVGQ